MKGGVSAGGVEVEGVGICGELPEAVDALEIPLHVLVIDL